MINLPRPQITLFCLYLMQKRHWLDVSCSASLHACTTAARLCVCHVCACVCILQRNAASLDGAGLRIEGSNQTSSLLISNSVFDSNSGGVSAHAPRLPTFPSSLQRCPFVCYRPFSWPAAVPTVHMHACKHSLRLQKPCIAHMHCSSPHSHVKPGADGCSAGALGSVLHGHLGRLSSADSACVACDAEHERLASP